ncbi:MAG TPA: protein kinase [Gemmatimonadales bacterium]|nr:protein kinase [Gemmatimonadales bacterium]
MTPLPIDALNQALAGRYRIERPIGEGGMATVYLAEDVRHHRKVAIKLLKPHLAAVIGAERFLAEIRTTANLHHPHILQLHDSGETEGSVFYVMPYVAGESLRDRLTREQRLPIDEAIRIITEVADAVQHAHDQGVIHRDIKPENILLDGQHALVSDFGIALSTAASDASRMTAAGMSLGTPAYMSPEQAVGETNLDARSDVYSMGCVLHEMLVGSPPFRESTAQAILAKVLTERPSGITAQRDRVPAHVDAAVIKSLEKHPADRFASAHEFAAALRDPTFRHGPSASRRAWMRSWRGFAAGAGLVLGIAVVAWLTRRVAAPSGEAGTPGVPSATILIGGVENRTGDTAFDAILPELLTTTLEQSHAVSVFPRANVPQVLMRMQRPPDTRIDETIGREIAEREGLSAVVQQSITKLGSSYVLVVSLVRPDGQVMTSTQETLADVSELPARLDAVGQALRRALGESSAELAKASVPLEQVTSRSLEALRFYSQGTQRLYAGDVRTGIVLVTRATEIDTTFAMAHAVLGAAYTNLQDMEAAAGHLQMAARFAERAPAAERERILGNFAMTRRDYSAACPHFEVLTAERPGDASALGSLGWCSAWKLDFATAVSATEKAYAMAPSPRLRINRAMVAFLSGDLPKALENARAVRDEVPGLLHGWYVEGKTLMAQGQFDSAHQLYQRMVTQGGDLEIEGHLGLADVARTTGRMELARTELEAAHGLAAAKGNVSVSISSAMELAELALEQGRQDRFTTAMAMRSGWPSDPWLVYRIGRAFARGGNGAEAEAAIRAIDALSIGPSPQYDALRSLLQAEIALQASRAADAVTAAQAAVRSERSVVAFETLGRASLAAKQWTVAAGAFEQVVNRPQERCDSYDAPACYRVMEATYWLGRLKDEAGDKAGAAPLLRRFVTTWAGASGQPMLEDATRRLGSSP